MTSALHIPLRYTPLTLGRMGSPPPETAPRSNELLEEAILVQLRQHYPTYLKIDGTPIRCAIARAFIRFVLERAGGNCARAAENAGLNRNTIRRLARCLAVNTDRNAT